VAPQGNLVEARASQKLLMPGARLSRLRSDFSSEAACRDRVEPPIPVELQTTVGNATKTMRLLQNRVEDRRKLARRGVDDAQDLGHRLFLSLIFVTLDSALGKLALEIGDDLCGIGQRAVRRRAHLRTSSGRVLLT
jgi:hypothetical protein